MIVTDIDGTLLNDDHKISEYTKEMIHLIKDDISFVLASARGYYSIKPLIDELALNGQYVIAFNGAYVLNTDGQVLNDVPLDREVIYKLIAFIKDSGISLKVYLYHQDGRDCIDDIDIEEYLDKYRIYKLVADGTKEDIMRARSMMADINELCTITSSLDTRFEAVAKGINKVDAIKMIASELGISKDEIVCVGDGENDIAMIRYAGMGVAMANGQDDVLKCADMIVKDNNNDGIADIIDLLFG